MSKFETRFETDDDAEKIRAAFRDFVERDADNEVFVGDAHISAEFDTHGGKLCARLGSAWDMDTFLADLSNAVRSDRRSCLE